MSSQLGSWLLLVGAVGVLIGGCLPWYQVQIDFGSLYHGSSWSNAWDTWTGIIAGAMALSAFLLFGIRLYFTRQPVRSRGPFWIVYLVLGILALFGVLITLFQSLAQTVGQFNGITDGPAYGVFISIGAACVLCAGALLAR